VPDPTITTPLTTTPVWPSHRTEERPWRSAVRGPRADRLLRSVRVSLPPPVAGAVWSPDDGTAVLLARAALALRALDDAQGTGPLQHVLARTEAVSSSRIEHEHATTEDVARALVGSRANAGATATVRAAEAIVGLVEAASCGTVDEPALLRAHHHLMRDDPLDGPDAGRYREVQNWIGGGATPRTARYVPPPPEHVPALMADLFAFLRRDDLHPVAQAAIAHAQFESIHPFTDGNGRIGRALVAAVLRARGAARSAVVPLAVVLDAERDRYFAHLERYRQGAVDDWVRDLAIAVGAAADEALVTSLLLAEVGVDRAAGVCRSGVHAVLGRALEQDSVLTEDHAERLVRCAAGGTGPGVGRDVEAVVDRTTDDLCRAGVLRPVTTRRQNRAWVAPAVVAELDAFVERVRDGVDARARGCPAATSARDGAGTASVGGRSDPPNRVGR